MTDRTCFDCGKKLEWVPKPSFLNSDQWDAEKAGDFFAKCEKSVHKNGNCYFKNTPGVATLKPKQVL